MYVVHHVYELELNIVDCISNDIKSKFQQESNE